MPIDQAVAEIWQFFNFFFKMAAIRYLGFVIRVFGPPTRSICTPLCHCAKFGRTRCSSFDKMWRFGVAVTALSVYINVSNICNIFRVRLKNGVTSKNREFWQYSPQ